MANPNVNQKPNQPQTPQRPPNAQEDANKFGNKGSQKEQQSGRSTPEKGSSNVRGSRPSGAV